MQSPRVLLQLQVDLFAPSGLESFPEWKNGTRYTLSEVMKTPSPDAWKVRE